MNLKERRHLITLARNKVAKLNEQRDKVYDSLLLKLNTDDERSFLFDYIYNGSTGGMSGSHRSASDIAKLTCETKKAKTP
jgi:hypothetical protein